MEEVKLLKYTLRGLTYRYNALKKISSLLGEAKDEADFIDKSLGIIMEMSGAEACMMGAVEMYEQIRINAFRSEAPCDVELKIIEKLSGITEDISGSSVLGVMKGKEKFFYSGEYDLELDYQKTIAREMGGISDIAVVPVRQGSGILGVIELYNLAGGMNKEKEEALIGACSQIGVCAALLKRLALLQHRTATLKDLASVIEAVSAPYQLKMVLDVITENALNFFGADGCTIFLKNEAGIPEFAAVSGEKAETLRGSLLEPGEGIAGWVIDNGLPELAGEAGSSGHFSERIDALTGLKTGSVICVPLKIIDDVIGAVEIVRSGTRTVFREEDLSLLTMLASHASIAIDKARMFTQKERWLRSTIDLLSKAIDTRSHLIPGYSDTVKKYVSILGHRLGLDSQELEYLNLAASVQDIGKLTIPEKILEKQDDLSDEEWEEVRKHPLKSVEILETVEEFREIIPIIKYHHENYDGTGYPEGLSGENIPRLARVFAVADAFAAMCETRPYREAMSKEQVLERMQQQKGKKFDPEIVGVLVSIIEKEDSSGQQDGSGDEV